MTTLLGLFVGASDDLFELSGKSRISPSEPTKTKYTKPERFPGLQMNLQKPKSKSRKWSAKPSRLKQPQWSKPSTIANSQYKSRQTSTLEKSARSL